MKPNVGNLDKWIRIILGVAVIVLGFIFQSWWGLVGLVLLLTGFLNYCPIWGLLGVSTRPKVETEKLKVK